MGNSTGASGVGGLDDDDDSPAPWDRRGRRVLDSVTPADVGLRVRGVDARD
ncbi:MAG: hypothetical protein ACP5P1_06695 [Acidimicrobiales bacterium]